MSSQTKDEMQRECEQRVEDCLDARFDVGVGNIDAAEWNEKVAAKNTAFDAYAQAAVDAALADTLGLLEALAKRDEGDDSCEIPWAEFGRGTRSPSVAVSGYQEGLRYFRVDEDGTEHPISRDDALALLAGEEKKECP